MITIMKASAGSGKTYALSHRYIDMLLHSDDPAEYRHILAVTFTNKATDEMKSRIIEELFKIDTAKSRRILADILHDYSSFAVSTIDRFFQQTLRSFARELGQFSRYQVELDKDALVDEAVDTILDELNIGDAEDRKMVDFIVENMEEIIGEGGKPDVEGALKDMARQLKSESFARKCSQLGMDRYMAYDNVQLSALKKTCRGIVIEFENRVDAMAEALVKAAADAGLAPGDFSRGWFAFIEKYRGWKHGSDAGITDSVRKKIEYPSPESWFAKAKQNLFPAAFAAVGEKLAAFLSLWESDEFRTYNTALILMGQVYGLGVAARLFQTFDRVAKEKNVVCLDESNSLLRDIIDGSDAPFVYEKTGVRFRTFLLDEFQDTSSNQWDNFLPLLKESESNKDRTAASHEYDNLIVGDVKQSIYRWRESDWNLLDSEVEKSFAGDVHQDILSCNWRSLNGIIEFNNKLYPALAAALDALNPVPEGMRSVSEIYSGCAQTPGNPAKQEGGCVDVEFAQGDEEQLQKILETVVSLRDGHNASYGDIAVLVRKKNSGAAIAGILIDNGIPVVTDASLRLKNSVSVRRIVSMMAYVDNPDDAVGSFSASRYGLDGLPSSYHNLTDLAESLYKALCGDASSLEDCRNEAMYITSFMDFVADYSNSNGNNLHEFLDFWKDKDPNVNTTSSPNAVSIITIHKSKGLAFPYVIIPFAEKISLYDSRKTRVWAAPENCGEALSAFENRLFYVPLNERAAMSNFCGTYAIERFNQGVDALNLLYVATTRAERGMKIISNAGGKQLSGSIAGLLYDYCGQKDFHSGDMADFVSAGAGGETAASEYVLRYPYYNIDERLSIRPYAAEFFSGNSEDFGGLSWRERGIVLHDILGRVARPSDLEAAVESAIADGSLAENGRAQVLKRLSSALSAHPEFFPEDPSVEVLMEETIIGEDGSENKPDRVLLYPDGRVRIVDYKFGSMKDEYYCQIERYRKIFIAMGYKDVKACLWLVYQNKIF